MRRVSFWCVIIVFGACPVTLFAQIGSETNVNQKTTIGNAGGACTLVLRDGSIRADDTSIRFQIGNPPQAIERLPFVPQTLIDGRTPAVVTRRDLGGVRYQCVTFDADLPNLGRTLVVGLKAVNTTDKPETAQWNVETLLDLGERRIVSHGEAPPAELSDVMVAKPSPAADQDKTMSGWCDGNERPTILDNPWTLASPDNGRLRNWTPSAPIGLRDSRAGFNGASIRYVFRVEPNKRYSVAVAFCEGHWKEKGHRLMDVDIQGQTVAKAIDALAQGESSGCVVIAADAPAAKNGLLRVTIRAANGSPDSNPVVSAIWLFENTPAAKLDCKALVAGQINPKPLATVACGKETYLSLRGKSYTYRWPLKPGESRQGLFLKPYKAASTEEIKQAAQPLQEMLTGTQEHWKDWWAEGATFCLPDREAEDLYYASLTYLMILRKQVGDFFLVTPGPENYGAFWYRDAAAITRVFDVSGHSREAEESLRVFWNHPLPAEVNRLAAMGKTVEQGADGKWATPADEFDSQGQAVWGLMSHYEMTGDRAWLQKAYPAILAGAKWTRDGRRATKITDSKGVRVPYYGLLPKGFGESISEYCDGKFWGLTHVLYHNFWALDGLRRSAEAAEALGRTADAKWIREEYKDFHKCLNDICRRDYVRLPKGGYWKAAPDWDRGPGWWQAAALYPCEAIASHDPMLDGIFTHFRTMKSQGIWPNWPYISTDWAQGHLLRDEPDEAESIYLAYIRKATNHRTWCETLDAASHIGDGDQPHGWAAADYVLLLRNMLLAERNGKLSLCQAIPRDWLADGKKLDIQKAPTAFGTVDLTVRSELAKGRIEYRVRRNAARGGPCIARLSLRAPGDRTPTAVEINGVKQTSPGKFVEFPLESAEVRVVAHYDS